MARITLTKRQHELMWMDCYCEYSENGNPVPELRDLRDELRRGRVITITPLLMVQLSEFKDRDQDALEQRVYRGLMAKAKRVAG